MAYTQSNATTASGPLETAARVLSKLRTQLGRRALFNRTVRELRALSGAELADLGITRGEICGVAREAVYGR